MAEGEPFRLVDALKRDAKFAGARELITIDGLRVEYADGFGLARPSNTTPCCTPWTTWPGNTILK
jgi:phosphomannomutase/phosphoglucomutase